MYFILAQFSYGLEPVSWDAMSTADPHYVVILHRKCENIYPVYM